MTVGIGFWDASALVPLCVDEAASPQARTYLKQFEPVVWWGSIVEIHSAISRLHRENRISIAGRNGGLARAELLSASWREILPDDQLRSLAIQLLRQYPLRSADSLQLAASLIWCNERAAGKPFVSGDRRLSQAAAAAGFSVVQIAPHQSLSV